jgi:hypothetical protein
MSDNIPERLSGRRAVPPDRSRTSEGLTDEPVACSEELRQYLGCAHFELTRGDLVAISASAHFEEQVQGSRTCPKQQPRKEPPLISGLVESDFPLDIVTYDDAHNRCDSLAASPERNGVTSVTPTLEPLVGEPRAYVEKQAVYGRSDGLAVLEA